MFAWGRAIGQQSSGPLQCLGAVGVGDPTQGLAKREPGGGELLLVELEQEVGLVLGRVDGAAQTAQPGLGIDVDPRIVSGGDALLTPALGTGPPLAGLWPRYPGRKSASGREHREAHEGCT